MTDHHHLLVETPHGGPSRGMQYLNGVYTERFNRRHGRVGLAYPTVSIIAKRVAERKRAASGPEN